MSRGLTINDNHRRIFSYLANGDTPEKIADNLHLKPSSLYRTMHSLERIGYLKIEKVGLVLNINLLPPAIKELSIVSVGKEKVEYIRLHDLWVATEILSKPNGWSNDFVEKILEEKSVAYTKHNPANWKGTYFDYAPVKVRVTPNKILFKLPQVEVPIEDKPEHAKNIAIDYLDDVIPRIENLLKVQLSKPREATISVSSQHIAFVKNKMAKYFLEKDISLRIYDDDGKLRVIVDQSNMNAELECVNKEYAEEDANKLQSLIKDTITGKFDYNRINEILGETAMLQQNIIKNQNSFSSNQELYGQRIAEHTVAIKKLGVGIEKLTNLVERIESKRIHKAVKKVVHKTTKSSRITKSNKKLPKVSLNNKRYWEIIRKASKLTGKPINEVRKSYKNLQGKL